MARELSQAELLDFLCQAGGRVANAALLAHFKRFLRDPQAPPAQLQHRRQIFKGFVNSVATVSQDGPGAATYVVLRKRYRDLVGEEPRPTPHDGPLAEPPLPLQQARWERAGKSREAASPREIPGPDGSGRLSDGQLAAARRAARCPSGTPGTGPQPPLPASPAVGCLGRERKNHRPPVAEPAAPDPRLLQERAQRSNGLGLPVREMGALPSAGSAQQRIRDWIVTHHSAAAEPFHSFEEEEEDAWPVRAGSQSSELSTCHPWGSLDFGPRSESSEGCQNPPVPVFRSIRCRLSLQDLEDHLDQESSASEEGSSSASRGSSSYRGEGETGRTNNGCIQNSVERQGPGGTPHSNGLAGMPFAQASQDSRNGKSPPHVALLHQVVGRAAILGKTEGRALLKPKPRKMDGPASPTLDAPLSPWLAARQRSVTNAPFVERLAPNTDGLAEHRTSLVPLDGREHTWLVKIAAGSWMQVRALFQEDPQLMLHKDFISGFTVLHWLAKHGNAQLLQDFVTGAQEAGIVLDVNVRSGCGYTPLHLAAIHSHPLIMKILVQKLQCQTQIRDSSGKKPWQYLSTSASGEIWQLLGGPRGRTIFPTHPIIRPSTASSSSSAPLARKVSRKPSFANYLKPQHMKWKVGYMCPIIQETEEYND